MKLKKLNKKFAHLDEKNPETSKYRKKME